VNTDTDSGSDPFETISDFFESGAWDLMILLLQVFAVALWAALIFWTYQDARRRIAAPGVVAVCVALSVVIPYLGSIIYLIVRPPEYLDEARERELELLALEQRLGELDDDEGKALVGKLLAREGISDSVPRKVALRQAGVALEEDVRDLEARIADLEKQVRGRAALPARVESDEAGLVPGDTGRRTRPWRSRQNQDAHD
jgi:hypothetical protein